MKKSTPRGLYKLGNVVKAQGTRGGFLMEVFGSAEINFLPDLVYLRYPENQWVPYRISEVRKHQDRSRNMFFVILEGIDSRTEAESLRGDTVMTDQPVTDEDESESLTGYEVFREDESMIGVVSDVLETPAYSILVVQSQEKQILIPWIDQFVTGHDHDKKSIMTKNTFDLESLE